MWIYRLFVTADTRALQRRAQVEELREGGPAKKGGETLHHHRPMADRSQLLDGFQARAQITVFRDLIHPNQTTYRKSQYKAREQEMQQAFQKAEEDKKRKIKETDEAKEPNP